MQHHEQINTLTTNSPGPSADDNILTAASGGGILMFGNIIEFVGRFAFGIIIARSIGATGYGLTVLGVTVATFLAILAKLGLQSGFVHFLPFAVRKKDPIRIWDILQTGLILSGAIGLGLGVLLSLSSGLLAEKLFHEPALVPILRWAGIAVPLMAIGELLMAASRGFMQMQYQVIAGNIIQNIGKLFLSVLFIYFGMGAVGVMSAYSITWIVIVGVMLYFVNRLFPLRHHRFYISKQATRSLLSFSLPVWGTQLVNRFSSNFDVFFLSTLGTLASVGIYSATLRIQLLGFTFLAAMEMASKPIISDLYTAGDIKQLGHLYQSLTRWCLTFVLPYFITIVFFAAPILAIFGDEFRSGALTLVILSLGMLVNGGTGICGAMVIMTGQTRLEFLNIVGVVVLNTILDVILIPKWGMVGAAIGGSLSLSLINIARLIEIHWLLKLWPYNASFAKPLLASAISLSVMFLVTRLIPADINIVSLILNILILWIVFGASIMLLGLSSDDRMLLSRVGKRFGAKFRKV